MPLSGDSVIDNALIQKSLNGLQSEDKRKRKSAIDELRKHLFTYIKMCPSLLQDQDDICKGVLRCFSDQSEACREAAVLIFNDLFSDSTDLEVNLTLLMPVLSVRLGSDEMVEPSEEVRLALVELLHIVVQKTRKKLIPYFNDIISMLKKTINDPFPKIKKESCECASSLAISIPEQFHMQSESLVKPLTQILTHQQYRVRVSAILALGTVVRFGNNKSIKDVIGPFAERLFDQTPQVRAAVTQVVGDWLKHLPDRYSYFHLMIPLILTSLNDQSPDIQERAWCLWNEAGEQWKIENEDDVKDKVDYLDILPSHYPQDLRRPNIGCRILVKRNLHKIAPALVRELEDWHVDVRIKASQLLCVLILNAECDLHQYLEQLLVGMYRACNDEDQRVVNNIERAGHLVGYFIPPDNYWALMRPIMEDYCHQGHIRVLASIISGAEVTSFLLCLPTIATFLQQPSICRSLDVRQQSQLVKCCDAIMIVCKEDSAAVSQQIFDILITALSLGGSDDVKSSAQGSLENLKTIENMQEIHELYGKFMRPLLKDVCSTPELWTVHCPERLIFVTLILNSGPALSDCLDIMIPALSASLQPENQDAEMKLKLLTSVAIILQNSDKTHCIAKDLFDPFLLSLLKGVIAPNLIWKAGRTAEALRTITVSCLLSILQTHGAGSEETVTYMLDSIVPILLTLVEDSSKKTRLYSCHCLSHIISAAQTLIQYNAEHVHKIYCVVMKRLDDVDDVVRKSAVEILRKLFSNLPADYNLECSSAHIEALYSTLLIHLDDPCEEFGSLLLGVLKDLSALKPCYLLQRLKATQSSFRNQNACTDLSEYIFRVHSLRLETD